MYVRHLQQQQQQQQQLNKEPLLGLIKLSLRFRLIFVLPNPCMLDKIKCNSHFFFVISGSDKNRFVYKWIDCCCCTYSAVWFLGAFTANTASQLDVFGHDGDTLGMNRAQICVFKQANQVRLTCLLERHHCRTLET